MNILSVNLFELTVKSSFKSYMLQGGAFKPTRRRAALLPIGLMTSQLWSAEWPQWVGSSRLKLEPRG